MLVGRVDYETTKSQFAVCQELTMSMAPIPLLVVGGRTTGLMMAAELARHGAPVRIVDKSPGIDPHSRATLLHSRTLEIFDGLGFADQIVAIGQPMRRILLYADGKLVGQSQEDEANSPFPHGIALSQAKTEAILERHLNSLGVTVERDTELTNIEAHDSGVRVKLKHATGAREIIETPWLIGCDGAHSTVRHLSGVGFPGEADLLPYSLADVIVEGPLQPDDVHIYLHDEGELFLFVLDEGRRLVVASGARSSDPQEVPTLEQMQTIVTRRGGGKYHLADPRWLATFHIHYRLAPHHRHGRVFLAGDAAHIHSPIGGQGMNTGIQDAHNLAWKLALVLRGVAPETWLDTYEIERRRVAEDVIAMTRSATQQTEMFAQLSPPDRVKLCKHMFVPESEKQRARRHAEELDLDYRSSPLCIEPTGNFDAGPHAGSQVLDAAPLVVDGARCSFFDLLHGSQHRLLLFAGVHEDKSSEEVVRIAGGIAERHQHWIEVFVVRKRSPEATLPAGVIAIEDPQSSLHQRYGAVGPCMYLIRPDGYIAYRSSRIDSLEAYLASVL
jgi:2-polyprenyl-6-methoxyphenol hydroxylase-like FAD-dependent oxidoreductase